jgi:ABC-2 type transport system permease protein
VPAVWLHNVFTKTLRDCRAAMVMWGVGLGVLTPVIFVSVPILLASPVGREEIVALMRNPVVRLFAEPVDVLSPGGYATWRLSLLLPMLAVWSLLAFSWATRGEEESGAFELLLSVSGSRVRVVLHKLGALSTALAIIGVAIGAFALAGAWATGVALRTDRALLFGLNASLFALMFGAMTFFVSQFTRERRTAAGAAGILLGTSFVLTSAGRVVPHGAWIGRLSPLHYFEANKPLIPGSPVSIGAFAAMAVLAALFTLIALVIFVNRDIGAPYLSIDPYLPRRPTPRHLPMRSWSLRSILTRNVRVLAGSAVWWGLGLGLYSLTLTALLQQIQQNVSDLLADLARNNPVFAGLIERFIGSGGVAANMLLLNAVFTVLVVVVVGFAVSLVNHWASDEEEGRLDLLLAASIPRHRLMLSGFSADTVALIFVAGSVFVGATLAARLVGMQLDATRVAAAALAMVTLSLVIVAIGYLLAGWLRARVVTGVLITLVLASFALTLIGPLFHWPRPLLQLSIFEHYGAPLVEGVQGSRVAGQLGVAAATLAAAVVRFARKDLTR